MSMMAAVRILGGRRYRFRLDFDPARALRITHRYQLQTAGQRLLWLRDVRDE